MVVKRNSPLSGVVNVTITSGDGTQAVSFHPDIAFTQSPSIIISFAESLGSGKRGFCAATSITPSGFTALVDSDSALSDIDLSWIAVPRRSTEEASQ